MLCVCVRPVSLPVSTRMPPTRAKCWDHVRGNIQSFLFRDDTIVGNVVFCRLDLVSTSSIYGHRANSFVFLTDPASSTFFRFPPPPLTSGKALSRFLSQRLMHWASYNFCDAYDALPWEEKDPPAPISCNFSAGGCAHRRRAAHTSSLCPEKLCMQTAAKVDRCYIVVCLFFNRL